jgi:hypothetical protein
MPYLIDPPGPFEPTRRWEEVLAQLKKMPQDDPSVRIATEEAEEQLASRQRGPSTDEDSSGDRFPLSEGDLQGIIAIAGLFRSQLATMTPAQLRSVAALLLALKRLPHTTRGVDVSLTYAQPNTDGNYGWATIDISEHELRLGIGEHFYDPGGGGDTESQTLFETYAGADSCQGDIELWLSYAEARAADGSLSIEADSSDIDWDDYGEEEI